MSMITYPLNNVEYTAEDAELYNCTRTSGVYSGEDFSCTVSGTNNNVTIGKGVGWIRNSRFSGKVFANKARVTLKLDIADAINPRIDIVAVRFDVSTNTTDLVIKKGMAAANPVMPEIVQTENVYELYLFSVYRETAATAITADNVTDLRLDASVCGLMADAVTSVDTSVINKQFTAYLEHIKKELADLKVDKIDAYTREETLSDFTKEKFGMGADAVPDDVLALLSRFHKGLGNEYVWEKGKYVGTADESLRVYNNNTIWISTLKPAETTEDIEYSDTVSVVDGEIVLNNPSVLTVSYNTYSDIMTLIGKYVKVNSDSMSGYGGQVLYIKSGGNADQNSDYRGCWFGISSCTAYLVSVAYNFVVVDYVNSPDPNAYPPAEDDGYTYIASGQLGNRVQIATGSYTGTGTYGEVNPNSLTFDFEPKIVIILPHIIAAFGASLSLPVKYSDSTLSQHTEWNGNTFKWYQTSNTNNGPADWQCNKSGKTYYYTAIG